MKIDAQACFNNKCNIIDENKDEVGEARWKFCKVLFNIDGWINGDIAQMMINIMRSMMSMLTLIDRSAHIETGGM